MAENITVDDINLEKNGKPVETSAPIPTGTPAAGGETTVPEDVQATETPPEKPIETPPADTPPETPVVETPVETPTDTPPETPPEPIVEVPVFDYTGLSKSTGFVLEGPGDVETLLNEHKELKSRDVYHGIEPHAQLLDKALKAGMDMQQYLSAMVMDPEKMSDTQAIKARYELDNADLFKTDPDFADVKFRREQAAKYGAIDSPPKQEGDFETPEEHATWKQQWEADNDYLKREQANQGKMAKNTLAEWKAKNTTLPEQGPPVDNSKVVEQYHGEIDTLVGKGDGMDVDMGGEVFKYSMPEEKRRDVGELMKDPFKALETLGYTAKTGHIDVDRLYNVLYQQASMGGLGAKMSEYVLEKHNTQTIEAKEKGIKTPVMTPGPSGKSEAMEIAEGLQADGKAKEAAMNY